jgi:phosphopantetheine--protein transferase-like protein
MDQAAALRSTLAEFLGVSPESLTADFSLRATKLNSSIQRAMLYAQLRSKAGLSVRGMPAFETFGALEAQLTGRAGAPSVAGASPAATASTPASTPASTTAISPSAPIAGDSPIACGIDIESVAALPPAADYWEHAFYTSHFTREEIAACLLQAQPAVHLAGRWCVKEALKKCDARFLTAAMNEIEVRPDAAGAPAIWDLTNGGKRRLPYAVSLSHTGDFAVAAVVRLLPWAFPQSPSPSAPAPQPAPAPPRASRAAHLLGLLGFLFSIVALALAAYTMWRLR